MGPLPGAGDKAWGTVLGHGGREMVSTQARATRDHSRWDSRALRASEGAVDGGAARPVWCRGA